MRVILTAKDLTKPLVINGQREQVGDRELLMKHILKNPNIIDEIIISKKQITVITKN